MINCRPEALECRTGGTNGILFRDLRGLVDEDELGGFDKLEEAMSVGRA